MTRYDSAADARPCLIVHGLYGSARNWNAIAKRLSETRPVVTVDLRNHGYSFWDDRHDYPALAGDLARVIDEIGHGPLDVIGHSMGGKASMVLALTFPHHVAQLLVADIAPVAYSHSQIQHIEAMQAVDLSVVSRRSDAAAQLAAQGVAPELQSFFTQSLDVEGRRWRLNLATLAAQMPDILGFPDIQSTYGGPVLFLSGAQSDYMQSAYRPAVKSLFPNAKFAKIPGAGHWLHAEKPREFVASAEAFFA